MIMHNRRGEKSGRADSGKTRKFIKEGQIIIINSFIKIFYESKQILNIRLDTDENFYV